MRVNIIGRFAVFVSYSVSSPSSCFHLIVFVFVFCLFLLFFSFSSFTFFFVCFLPHLCVSYAYVFPLVAVGIEAEATDHQQKLERQLNEYIRLYADSQAENEKLKLDVRRHQNFVETEKVIHRSHHCQLFELHSAVHFFTSITSSPKHLILLIISHFPTHPSNPKTTLTSSL